MTTFKVCAPLGHSSIIYIVVVVVVAVVVLVVLVDSVKVVSKFYYFKSRNITA